MPNYEVTATIRFSGTTSYVIDATNASEAEAIAINRAKTIDFDSDTGDYTTCMIDVDIDDAKLVEGK